MEYKPGIRQRGDVFQFTVSVGFDGNGRQLRRYMTYHPPIDMSGRQLKRAVEAAYDEFYLKVTNNQSLKENMRFSELGHLYFTQYAPNCLKEITAYTYEGSYRKNIEPVFGNTRLKDLTTARIKLSYIVSLNMPYPKSLSQRIHVSAQSGSETWKLTPPNETTTSPLLMQRNSWNSLPPTPLLIRL